MFQHCNVKVLYEVLYKMILNKENFCWAKFCVFTFDRDQMMGNLRSTSLGSA